MPVKIEDAGTIWINDGSSVYPVKVILRESGRDFDREEVPEPPYSELGNPVRSVKLNTTHLGMGHSKLISPGHFSYSQNILHSVLRVRPGLKINVITLTSSTATPGVIFSADRVLSPNIWIGAGTRFYRIGPNDTTPTAVLSKTFTGAVKSGLQWKGYALATEDASTLWNNASGLDTWSQGSASSKPNMALLSTEYAGRLYGVTHAPNAVVKNVLAEFDEMDLDNWQDAVPVGDQGSVTYANGLAAAYGSVYVGSYNGFLGINREGYTQSITPELGQFQGSFNASSIISHKGHLIFGDHLGGLWRWRPGARPEAIGLEWESLDNSPIKYGGEFIWQYLASDGKYIYGARNPRPGSSTTDYYLCRMRDRVEGESGFGPLVVEPILYSGSLRFGAIVPWYALTPKKPRLYFGYGVNLAFINLDELEFQTNGTSEGGEIIYPSIVEDIPGEMWVPRISVTVRNPSATKYWRPKYSVDGGSFLSVDRDNVDMKAVTEGRNTFKLPTTAVGRYIGLKAAWVSDSATVPPELEEVEVSYIPRPRYTRARRATVRLAQNQLYDGLPGAAPAREVKTVEAQYNLLQTLSENKTPVIFTGMGMSGVKGVLWGGLKAIDFVYEHTEPGELLLEMTLVLEDE